MTKCQHCGEEIEQKGLDPWRYWIHRRADTSHHAAPSPDNETLRRDGEEPRFVDTNIGTGELRQGLRSPGTEAAKEAISWAETFDHGRFGDDIAKAAIQALIDAGLEIAPTGTTAKAKAWDVLVAPGCPALTKEQAEAALNLALLAKQEQS